jgi:DNA polymerase
MFIGEAPGADEDARGEPFVGRAGQLLTKIIEAMGMKRNEVYIANVLKCRPPENRTPLPDETLNCLPYLEKQIELIHPKVIVALGATALRALLDIQIGITKMRGNWYNYRDIPIMPTFHPAYLLRNPPAKKAVWQDMKAVLAKLGREVPKQA